jgi:hypothetical protein
MIEKITGNMVIDSKYGHLHIPRAIYNNLKVENYKYVQPDYLLRGKIFCFQFTNEKTDYPILNYEKHSVISKGTNIIKEVFGPGKYSFTYITDARDKLIIEFDAKLKKYPVYPELKKNE